MVDVGNLSAFVTEWRGTIGELSKIIYNQTLHERWDRTDFAKLTLPLANETQTSLTF